MYEARKINVPSLKGRIETGPVKFNDDWTGLFIRGDDAAYYGLCLVTVLKNLEELDPNFDLFMSIALRGLVSMLQSTNEFGEQMGIVKLRVNELKKDLVQESDSSLSAKQTQAWKEFEKHYNAIYQILLENVSRETDRNQAHIKLRELFFWTNHHLPLRDK